MAEQTKVSKQSYLQLGLVIALLLAAVWVANDAATIRSDVQYTRAAVQDIKSAITKITDGVNELWRTVGVLTNRVENLETAVNDKRK